MRTTTKETPSLEASSASDEHAMYQLPVPITACLLTLAALFAPIQTAHAQTYDAPKLPVPPARQCTPGAIFTGTQDYNPTAPDWTGYAYPWNLIYKEWMRIGGPNSPIGCPIATSQSATGSVTDSAGTFVQFEHGQIAVSPGVWPQGVVAIYQDPIGGIQVDWTVSWDDPSIYNYTKFVVRWDYKGPTDTGFTHFDNTQPFGSDGGNERCSGDQCDVLADMGEVQLVLTSYYNDTHLRTKGTFGIPADHGINGNGTYRVAIEGCNEGTTGGSTCRQGWMHSVEVNFQPKPYDTDAYPVDLPAVPSASDVHSSQAAFFQRAAAFTLWRACRLLPWSAYQNEEDYGDIILAKLDYANYYQGDTCPGRVIDNRQEAFDSLRKQSVESKAGTTNKSIPFRTGEYDVALSRYIAMLGGFGGILPTDVYNHILNDLLNKRGGLDGSDFLPFAPVPISESENHLNNMESARFLTNELLFALTRDPQFDNTRNALSIIPGIGVPITMRDFWLNRLQNILKTDFIEYNARPYQSYTMASIQNLYSFAKDQDVKRAAGMVLDYVSAKLAASSNENRRVVPYRRKKEFYGSHNLLGYQADPQAGRMLALAGDLSILNQARITDGTGAIVPNHDFFAPWYAAGDATLAVESNYRMPDLILDAVINPKHRLFYQGIHHYADEMYAASPSYLISAGGHYATYAYTVAGLGKSDDIGNAMPTTVMPTGFDLSWDQLIRFEGHPDDTMRSNMCVAPDFACGWNLVLPPELLSGLNPGCVKTNAASIGNNPGSWTFINFTKDCRPSSLPGAQAPEGFYAAVYQRTVPIGISFTTLGLVEVFDAMVNPNVTFDQFLNGVQARNANIDNTLDFFSRANVYVTTTGRKIKFEFADSRVIDIANGPALVQSTTDFATGTIIQSSGTSAVVTVKNAYTGQQLTMDFSNVQHPVESLTSIPTYQPDTCQTGFVWRLADATDHVCVTTDIFTQTQDENKTAHAHIAPGTTDTCKQGYIWRLADPTDHVCVQPSSHDQAQWDNQLKPSRLAAPLP